MRALVTGSTGFIGAHLVAALAARGWQVRCLVRPTSRRNLLAAYPVEYAVGTLEDRASLRSAVRDVEVVFHLAGAVRVHAPADFERINAVGTRHLIEACAEAAGQLRKFLLISSIAAAGPSLTGQPVTEAEPPRPLGPYGRSKLLAEHIVLSYGERLPVMVLRPSAIYGPRDTDFFQLFQSIKYGVLLQAGRRELHVDLCYVADLVQGMIDAAECSDGLGDIFFLGGTAHSWRELGHEIARQMQRRVREVSIPPRVVLAAAGVAETLARLRRRPSFVNRANMRERLHPHWVYDSRKATRCFGYAPQTPLAQGIAITLQWYREAGWL